jgi:hypothetical protein
LLASRSAKRHRAWLVFHLALIVVVVLILVAWVILHSGEMLEKIECITASERNGYNNNAYVRLRIRPAAASASNDTQQRRSGFSSSPGYNSRHDRVGDNDEDFYDNDEDYADYELLGDYDEQGRKKSDDEDVVATTSSSRTVTVKVNPSFGEGGPSNRFKTGDTSLTAQLSTKSHSPIGTREDLEKSTHKKYHL